MQFGDQMDDVTPATNGIFRFWISVGVDAIIQVVPLRRRSLMPDAVPVSCHLGCLMEKIDFSTSTETHLKPFADSAVDHRNVPRRTRLIRIALAFGLPTRFIFAEFIIHSLSAISQIGFVANSDPINGDKSLSLKIHADTDRYRPLG